MTDRTCLNKYAIIVLIVLLLFLVFASYYLNPDTNEEFSRETQMINSGIKDTDYRESQSAPIDSMKIEIASNACRHDSILRNRAYIPPYKHADNQVAATMSGTVENVTDDDTKNNALAEDENKRKKVRWADALVEIIVE